MQTILKINLTTQSCDSFIIPIEWERDFIGGASLGARILYTYLTNQLDPFSPEAPLLFLCGPLTGTLGPAVGRFVVCGKSPATGIWAESNCGGFWGPELRFSGYDGLWITGTSETPIYLSIIDGVASFHTAVHLWGLDTYKIQKHVKDEINQPKAKVLAIGPAGEKKVLFAGIYCDHGRAAGRTGLGAVMGSKKLKAISVRGNGSLPISHPVEFNNYRSSSNRFLKNELPTNVAHDLGTASVADYSDYLGIMPKMYYSRGSFEGAKNISGSLISETILVGTRACHGCVIACGRVVDIGDGVQRKGPEYETLVGFGPNLLNVDINSIVQLGELCDIFGLDTISTGNVIGLAYKMFEDGILDKSQTEGLVLKWGDISGVKELITMIANRTGIGDIMANGAKQFAKKFGVENEAVQVNGLEVPYHDPHGTSGMALVYVTSPRGACHNKSDYFMVDWGQTDESLDIGYFPRQAGAEKAANVARHQNFRTVFDSLVMCLFSNITMDMLVELSRTATGFDRSKEDILLSGERAWNIKRVINIRMGMDKANEKLPKAFLQELPDGGSAGYTIPFEEMLDAYYSARDWDKATGLPTKKKLLELGLGEIAAEFYSSD
jgi:aldehyde:ferredoxin oxidoreductase